MYVVYTTATAKKNTQNILGSVRFSFKFLVFGQRRF